MRRFALLVLVVVLSAVSPAFSAEEYDPQHTMLALNMAIVSVHKILSAKDRIILDQEYQNIINNLSIGNIKSDPEITELYNKLIDIIGQKRLREDEAKQVKARYDSQMQNVFASSLSRVDEKTSAEMPGFWGSVVNMLSACVASYFRYEAGQNGIRAELRDNLYSLQADEMRNFTDMQKQLLSSSWNLMYKYHLPDEYRLIQKAMDDFYSALEEPDEAPRRLRMLRALEEDFKVYPPYWYYRARTALQANNQPEADKCFDVFDEIWRPVLRKDPYKLEVTKYRVNSLVKNGVPDNSDVRDEVLRLLGVMRENTLREDWTNNLFAGALYYALGDVDTAVKCVEINIDFKHETDISLAMLQQMRKGVKPSELAGDTLRGRKLNGLISGMDDEHKPCALAIADYFDGRAGAVEELETLASNDMNPLTAHALRLVALRKADTSDFRKIYTLAQSEISAKEKIHALYSGVFKLVKAYADEKNTPAQIFLADMYSYGWGVARDTAQAMNCYVKAGNKGDLYSQFMYINLVLGGQNYSQPEHKAAASASESADRNFDLGMGYYGQKAYTEAYEYFYRAFLQGHAGGAYMLGLMLENGQGRAKNPDAARSWYQKAANMGHDGAKQALKRFSR